MTRLREEFTGAGKAEEFKRLKTCLTAERGDISYAEIAGALGQSEGTVRVAVHRLRKRFREVFRKEIAQTVATTEEIEERSEEHTSELQSLRHLVCRLLLVK